MEITNIKSHRNAMAFTPQFTPALYFQNMFMAVLLNLDSYKAKLLCKAVFSFDYKFAASGW
ncbi:hypothetical protein SAMN04488029_0710 [Reichenbachiella faecimaris]|uniref:Uncharacterized protein n=1 Tax=Reichenbachiella faecimaris TaxID=692418 RepID=A0A1W2G6S5_REIFA|nr:hypothetical protein SAMN04488029_0710 [Reichenbachiella faecimaris]